ncbi:MAG: hypothetical protein KA746_01035 [Pyrinomonadaceae bacterium]|nr:hypothetical protein [Pyrinomonadaceae bacterium]MBP6213313.1 hypothetical protein [Pyrinomonadaceae bacterium]
MKKILLPLFILLFAVLGCSKIRELAGGSAGGSGGGTATAGTDPKEDITQAAKKFIALPAFSAKMEGMGQTEIKSQVDYVAPDRYHVTYLGGTGAGMEMIIIGSQSYMKPGGGSWNKVPGDAKSIPTLRDSFTEEGLKTLTDVKFDGEETTDGKAAMVYSYKNVTPVGNNPFTSKIWIDKSSGLPMKIYVEYPNGVLKNMTVKYDTESPITIEPPIK